MRHLLFAALAAACSASLAAPAAAEPFVEAIDVGVPTSGGVEMTGFRGYVIRAVSDTGPITRLGLRDSPGGGLIIGGLAQRWTDPAGNGDYTVTSPGPHPADNSSDSPFNFDTHLLPAPAGGAWSSVGEADGGVQPLTTDGNPVPSDGGVGYLRQELPPPYPFGTVDGGTLGGVLDLPASAGVTEVDFAYVVSDTSFLVVFREFETTGGSADPGILVVVPEPGGVGFMLGGAGLFLLRRRRRGATRPLPAA